MFQIIVIYCFLVITDFCSVITDYCTMITYFFHQLFVFTNYTGISQSQWRKVFLYITNKEKEWYLQTEQITKRLSLNIILKKHKHVERKFTLACVVNPMFTPWTVASECGKQVFTFTRGNTYICFITFIHVLNNKETID